MPLFEITLDQLRPLSHPPLSEMKVRERDDLRRLLRTQIDVLGEDWARPSYHERRGASP
jgi:hypothetical protein